MWSLFGQTRYQLLWSARFHEINLSLNYSHIVSQPLVIHQSLSNSDLYKYSFTGYLVPTKISICCNFPQLPQIEISGDSGLTQNEYFVYICWDPADGGFDWGVGSNCGWEISPLPPKKPVKISKYRFISKLTTSFHISHRLLVAKRSETKKEAIRWHWRHAVSIQWVAI